MALVCNTFRCYSRRDLDASRSLPEDTECWTSIAFRVLNRSIPELLRRHSAGDFYYSQSHRSIANAVEVRSLFLLALQILGAPARSHRHG
jgi:hypothetical protein